jgi:hypothetical protein
MSLEGILQAIDREIANLTDVRTVLVGFRGSSFKSTVVRPTKGRFSSAARRKMAVAQKARWSKYHATNRKTETAKSASRVMSPSVRRKIALAQKARWGASRAKKAKGAKKAA